MCAHQNAVQRAVVFGIAVVSALLNGAFNALVCLVIHVAFLLLIRFGFSMPALVREIRENFSFLAIKLFAWYDRRKEKLRSAHYGKNRTFYFVR